jgi:predicted RNA-binding protein with RPS1 domain
LNNKLHAIDQNIEKLTQETPDNFKLDIQSMLPPPYKLGTLLQARIQHIVQYGAFAEILDGKHHQGLIHVSNITGSFIDDARNWFQIGQELEVEFVGTSPDNKINLSVKHLNLSPRKDIESSAIASQLQNIIIHPSREIPHQIEENPPSTNEADKELTKIYEYLEKHLGCISQQSKEVISGLVKKHGVFTFSMIMMETLKEFNLDMSLIFAKEIQKKIGDGL